VAELSEALIGGVFAVVSSIAGGGIALIGTRYGGQIEKLRAENDKLRASRDKLLRQIEAYHLLEDLYARAVAGNTGDQAPRTIKTEYRDRVVEAHQCDRPHMTAKEAIKMSG